MQNIFITTDNFAPFSFLQVNIFLEYIHEHKCQQHSKVHYKPELILCFATVCLYILYGRFSSHIRVLNHINKRLTGIPDNKRVVVFFVNQYITSRKYVVFLFNKITLN